MAPETVEAVSQHCQGVEVVWPEHLPLDDGEANLDLIESTGVHRTMDRWDVGVAVLRIKRL